MAVMMVQMWMMRRMAFKSMANFRDNHQTQERAIIVLFVGMVISGLAIVISEIFSLKPVLDRHFYTFAANITRENR
jgi:hypothetical protein